MNTILWILQIILCIKFISTAYSHGLQKNNIKMIESVEKFGKNGYLLHKILSVIMFVESITIIIPGIIGLNNWITIYSAIISSILMAISIVFHIRSREKPIIIADIILLLISAFVAYGRCILAPL